MNSNFMPSPSCLQAISSAWFSAKLSSLVLPIFVLCSCSSSSIKTRTMTGGLIFYFGKRLQHISECSSKNNSQWSLPATPLYSGEDISKHICPPGCLIFLLLFGISFAFFWYIFAIVQALRFWSFLLSFIPRALAVVTLVICLFRWPN